MSLVGLFGSESLRRYKLKLVSRLEYQMKYPALIRMQLTPSDKRDLGEQRTNRIVIAGLSVSLSKTAVSVSYKRVLVFGTFDLLHPGHQSFLQQAAALGGYLTVVVARDMAVAHTKGRRPVQSAIARLAGVLSVSVVNEALLADKVPNSYTLLSSLPYEVLAVGYDQAPPDQDIKILLQNIGKEQVELVRLHPFKSHSYKTSRIRDTLKK